MALSQNIVQKQTQKLVITQEMRQSIELLTLSNIELLKKIEEELVENPLLDTLPGTEDPLPKLSAEKSSSLNKETENSAEDGWWKEKTDFSALDRGEARMESKHRFMENMLRSTESLTDHLLVQFSLLSLTNEEKTTGELIISAIDNRGFLSQDLESLIEGLEIPMNRARKVLWKIHTLDPIGCGARDMAESLYIQVKLERPEDEVSQEILKHYISDLERLDFKSIKEKTGFSENQIEKAIKFIQTLEPYPGTLYSPRGPDYIIPDVIVFDYQGANKIVVNDEWLPKLKINDDYAVLLEKKNINSKSDREFLQNNFNSAQWLIKSIQQRHDTLQKVSTAIIEFQHDFFDKGPGNLKPLILRQIAEKVERNESTVSRVTTNKYMQTRWGVFELKFFFSSSLGSDSGNQKHAGKTVQEKIKKLINEEDSDKPLSDQDLVILMKKEGVKIARRTVAKYRQLLRILPTDRRKKIKKLHHANSRK